jgi:hypothetical protein
MIQVMDQAGRIVKAISPRGLFRAEIPSDDLPSGTYHVRALLQNGTVHHLRAVVVH